LNLTTDDLRQASGRNTGVYVHVVYNETPAFYGNILREDVIIRINENSVNNTDEFYAIVSRLDEGDEIEVEYVRRNQTHITKIKL
jgi:S1-C subfamily serine protease